MLRKEVFVNIPQVNRFIGNSWECNDLEWMNPQTLSCSDARTWRDSHLSEWLCKGNDYMGSGTLCRTVVFCSDLRFTQRSNYSGTKGVNYGWHFPALKPVIYLFLCFWYNKKKEQKKHEKLQMWNTDQTNRVSK